MKTQRMSRLAFDITILGLLLPAAGYAEGILDFRGMTSGLIIPLDDHSMYVRNPEGQFEVRFQEQTEVAIKLKYGDIREMSDTTIRFENHKVLDGLEIALPAKQAYARFYVRRKQDVARIADTAMATGREKCNLHIYYEPIADNANTPPLAENFP